MSVSTGINWVSSLLADRLDSMDGWTRESS